MTVTAEFGRAQHLEEVLKLVQAKVPAAQRTTISAFVQRYYGSSAHPGSLSEGYWLIVRSSKMNPYRRIALVSAL